MKQTTTRLAPQRRPGLQTLKSALQRLTMTLMLVMLTATSAVVILAFLSRFCSHRDSRGR